MIKLEESLYEIIKDENKCYQLELVEKKYTDYFAQFDYIVGDFSYGNLRLKGFYDKKNSKCSIHNNIENIEIYISKKCTYGCDYFILKKLK